MGHASFPSVNRTPHPTPQRLDLDLVALSFSKRAFSFLPSLALLLESLLPLLCPCTLPSTTSASSAAALSKPRSARPSSRRAARATRYRVLTRAGAGVRLGKLCMGEEDEKDEKEGRGSDAALLVVPALVLA